MRDMFSVAMMRTELRMCAGQENNKPQPWRLDCSGDVRELDFVNGRE
jgi:hypothetical protein